MQCNAPATELVSDRFFLVDDAYISRHQLRSKLRCLFFVYRFEPSCDFWLIISSVCFRMPSSADRNRYIIVKYRYLKQLQNRQTFWVNPIFHEHHKPSAFLLELEKDEATGFQKYLQDIQWTVQGGCRKTSSINYKERHNTGELHISRSINLLNTTKTLYLNAFTLLYYYLAYKWIEFLAMFVHFKDKYI